MKMSEAFAHMFETVEKGFRVAFERVEGVFVKVDHFPHPGEEQPFKNFDQALNAAKEFAEHAEGNIRNIFVVNSDDHSPVEPFEDRTILRSTHDAAQDAANQTAGGAGGVGLVDETSKAPTDVSKDTPAPKKTDTVKKASEA